MKDWKEWLLTTSSNLVSGVVILSIGALFARPAYDHLLNVVQENHQSNRSSVHVEGSPNSDITVTQVLEGATQLTNQQTIDTLPAPYQEPFQNLQIATADVVAILKDSSALNVPVSEFRTIAGNDTVNVPGFEGVADIFKRSRLQDQHN